MSKQIKEFYVDREAECLTDEHFITLHEWCLEAGANDYEGVNDWEDCCYIGVDSGNDTYSTNTSYGKKSSIPFSEVRSHLGLSKLPTEPLTEELSLVGLSPSESVNTSKGTEPDALYKYKGIFVTVHYIGKKRSVVSNEFEEEFSIWTEDLEKVTIEEDITLKGESIMTVTNAKNIKRVNVGFKSVGEMAQAMFDGAILFFGNKKLKYVNDEGFIIESGNGDWEDVSTCTWNNFAEMEIEKEVMWWDEIDEDNPPLCKVWDTSLPAKGFIYVCKYLVEEDYSFCSPDNERWEHAIPTGLFKKDIDALGEEIIGKGIN